MKQYKLKQKYPSLPSDWEVGMEVGQGDRGSYGDYSPCHGKYSNRYLNASEVKNNPEFWEVVGYEILSIIGTNKHPLPETILYEKDVYKGDFTPHLNNSSKCWQIHSVKRLSDGKIFSIGDKFKYQFGGGKKLTIEGIQLKQDTISNTDYIWLQTDLNNPSYGTSLNYAVKVKEPLFKTVDNVEIFKGDSYWMVTNDFCLAFCSFFSETDLCFNCFAEKKNAQAYIEEYKNYTTADGALIVPGQTFYVYDNKFFNCLEGSFGTFKNKKWAGKRFRTKEEVLELIKENKIRFSLADLKRTVKENNCFGIGLINILEKQ